MFLHFIKSIIFLTFLFTLSSCASHSLVPSEQQIACQWHNLNKSGQNNFCSSPRVAIIDNHVITMTFDNGAIVQWDKNNSTLKNVFDFKSPYAKRSVVKCQDTYFAGSYQMVLEKFSSNGTLTTDKYYGKGTPFVLKCFHEKLYAGFGNAEVSVIDPTTLDVIDTYKRHEYLIYTIYIDRKRNILISGSDDNSIMLWKVHDDGTLNFIKQIKGFNGPIRSILQLPSNQFIVTTGRGEVVLYDKNLSSLLFKNDAHNGGIILSSLFAKDMLLTGDSNGNIIVWTVTKGKLVLYKKFQLNASVRILIELDSKVIAFLKDGRGVILEI